MGQLLFCFKTKYEWTKYRKMGKVIVCLFKVTIFGKPSYYGMVEKYERTEYASEQFDS